MMAVGRDMVVNRRANSILHAVGIIERFSASPATMKFRELYIGCPLHRPKFRFVMHLRTFVQFVRMRGDCCHCGQALANTFNVLARPAFVERNHFQCWFRVRRWHSYPMAERSVSPR